MTPPRDHVPGSERSAGSRSPPSAELPPLDHATRPVRTRRRLIIALVLVLAVALAVGAWYAMRRTEPGGASSDPAAGTQVPPGAGGRGKGDASQRTTPVVGAQVRKGSLDVLLFALGTVTPRNSVVVRSRVDGQLNRVFFEEGQMVKAGELLAQVDPRPFEVQMTQAAGQMARDEALLKNAQVDLERYRTLLAQDSISRQQVDTQESLVRQYQAAAQADQGAIDSAKLQLTYARVVAPISGRVGLRQVDPGNIVHPSDANGIVVITQLQPISVVFPIPQDSLPRVMQRLRAGETIPVDAYDREQKLKLASGRLLTADNQIDTATGTIKLKAEFPNTDGTLFANQFVNVRMVVETKTDATLAPTPAIQRGAPGTFVYVVKDDRTVSVVLVKLGPAQGEVTSIESGLEPGAMVVVDGADRLREGAKVELVSRDAQAVPAPGAGSRGQRRGKGGDKGVVDAGAPDKAGPASGVAGAPPPTAVPAATTGTPASGTGARPPAGSNAPDKRG